MCLIEVKGRGILTLPASQFSGFDASFTICWFCAASSTEVHNCINEIFSLLNTHTFWVRLCYKVGEWGWFCVKCMYVVVTGWTLIRTTHTVIQKCGKAWRRWICWSALSSSLINSILWWTEIVSSCQLGRDSCWALPGPLSATSRWRLPIQHFCCLLFLSAYFWTSLDSGWEKKKYSSDLYCQGRTAKYTTSMTVV